MTNPAPRVASLKTKITTAKLAETRAFYETFFGLVVREAWSDPGDVGVILGFPGAGADAPGAAFLEIYEGDGGHDFSGLSLQFRVPDVAAFAAFVGDRAPTRGPTPRPWGATYFYMTDPNGVAIVVFEGGL